MSFTKFFWSCALLTAWGFASPANAEVIFDPAQKVFRILAEHAEYDLGIDAQGNLQSLHWGDRLGDEAVGPAGPGSGWAGPDTPEQNLALEFAGQGAGYVPEPELKVAFPNGGRDLALRYRSHTISGDELTIRLSDIREPLTVILTYRIDRNTGILERSASVRNEGRRPVRIDQFLAAAFTLPYQPDYRLRYMTGRWASEWTMNSVPVTQAATVLESRRGSTSYHTVPWFALDRESQSTEEAGPVWFGSLGWSGSWRISVARDILGRVRVAGGFNPYDFAWQLRPGETVESPVFYAGYSSHGMGDASRLMHRFQRTRILPSAPNPPLRKVVYNSWEATGFDVTEAGQMALAEKAARIGIERFVMDDGWFGARDSDHAGLGDWTPSKRKFPGGLKPLIDKVKGLGMEFGLWVEPEMVNPDSDLYRAHPDWAMHFEGRPRTTARNQLVLNLARSDVRDYVLATLDKLLSENDIRYLKWDYNRTWTEPGWPEADREDQQRIYVDYTRNLYRILAELRRRHPGVEIEDCASGGGRVDLGILRYTDQVWTSDNTDPFERLSMQWNFSQAFTPGVMMAWTTDWGSRNVSLRYRFLSAMQGGLGIGNNLEHWREDDFAVASRMITDYKAVRGTIQTGSLFRLVPPDGKTPFSDTLYVSEGARQAVWFHMGHSMAKRDNVAAVQLRGLAPDKRYRASTLGGVPLPKEIPLEASGAWWLGHGAAIGLEQDYDGIGIVLDRV